MSKFYLIVADTGRIFRLDADTMLWTVFDDGTFEPYELPMDMVSAKSRISVPKQGALLIATFPGENRISQGKIVEVYKRV